MSRLAAYWVALTLPFMALPFAAQAIEVQEVTSPGGIDAWLVEENSLPFVSLQIEFQGGASLDREGKRGAVNMMSGLLEEGAGDLDARAFAKEVERLAAHFSFGASDDSFSVSAQFLNENRDQAVALLRQVLLAPRFDADAVERVRAQVISVIASDLQDPQSIAGRRFSAKAFGDHPYGSPEQGTLESVATLSAEDLRNAKDDVIALDRVKVGAAGDISAKELGVLLDELLGDLPAEGAPMPEQAQVLLEGGIEVVPFDTPQSVAIFGDAGIARDDPDFFAAFVMNHILGGAGFESRLMTEVREKRGLTYGIGSYLVPKDYAALIMGQVASSNDKIAESIEVIRAEWRKMAEEGVTEEELSAAKTYLTGAYPLRFDGNGRIASILAGMQLNDLPVSYIETRNDSVMAVTQEDVQRVAKRLLDADGLSFLVVGRPQGLEGTTN